MLMVDNPTQNPGWQMPACRRLLLVLAFTLLGACQNTTNSDTQAATNAVDKSVARGATVYLQHCATCHGDTGAGNEPWYPSLQRLAGLREPAAMVESVITGRFRRGGEFNSHTIPIMPAWGQLSDADVAAIVNYVQHNWGSATFVTPAQVGTIRNSL